METFIKYITDWPPILQSLIGSALFWILLQILTLIAKKFFEVTGSFKKYSKKSKNLREYIYRKYTSHDGLAYYPQGYFYTFSEVLKYFLEGFIFVCIALLFREYFSVITSVCLVGAIFFFIKALIWLIPHLTWNSTTVEERWSRIKELEENLFGNVSDDTLKFMEQVKSNKKDEKIS